MKKLFTMIRRGNLEEVAKILDKNPALIACTATAPPKKDDGQSPRWPTCCWTVGRT